MDTSKVTRFEVIDENGRAYVRNTAGDPNGVAVTLSLQDDGRTLKVFVANRVSDPQHILEGLGAMTEKQFNALLNWMTVRTSVLQKMRDLRDDEPAGTLLRALEKADEAAFSALVEKKTLPDLGPADIKSQITESKRYQGQPICRLWIELPSGIKLYFSDISMFEWATEQTNGEMIAKAKEQIAADLRELISSWGR